MQYLHTFESFLNEAKNYKGRKVLPDWIDTNLDFGKAVKFVKELKVGADYILWDPSENAWCAEYIYQGQTGGKHIFNSGIGIFGDGGPMEFTEDDIAEYIKKGEILEQN
jgi:hypothetical protein